MTLSNDASQMLQELLAIAVHNPLVHYALLDLCEAGEKPFQELVDLFFNISGYLISSNDAHIVICEEKELPTDCFSDLP